MRSLWTGSISFGIINIPVRLYSGSETSGGIDLRMLHKKDLSPIRYSRVCRKPLSSHQFEAAAFTKEFLCAQASSTLSVNHQPVKKLISLTLV